MESFASSGLEQANANAENLSLVWTILRENSCISFEAKVLILNFGAISCDIPLYQ